MHANDVAVSQPVAKSGAANFQNAAKAEPAIAGDPTLWHQRHIGINAEPLVRVLAGSGVGGAKFRSERCSPGNCPLAAVAGVAGGLDSCSAVEQACANVSHSSLPDKQLDNVDQHNDTMRFPTLIAGLMAFMATNVAATALTYKLSANEKACFYATTKNQDEKVAFYFAVSWCQPRCVALRHCDARRSSCTRMY